MIILDRPFVSDLLAGTAERLQLPVLSNDLSISLSEKYDLRILETEQIVEKLRLEKAPLVYTNSEDSIKWIEDNLAFTGYPERIDICKDKGRFRRLLAGEYRDFFFRELTFEALASLDTSGLKKPFIVKPVVGFFSLGVHKVISDAQWPLVLSRIGAEIRKVDGLYPREVLDTGRFIIEEHIDGDEFAVDLYYDEGGSPVILNILHHLFIDETDVTDRTYLTSMRIIKKYSRIFYPHLEKIGILGDFRNMPMHIEFRVDGDRVLPIEANPMRFAGWCATDIAWHAWGIDTVEYYFRQLTPDWPAIFKGREDKVFPLVIGLIPADIDPSSVKGIKYDEYLSNFKKLLEVRKTDFKKFIVFAFTFSETDDSNRDEIERMLQADMRDYLIMGED
ncbi:MAG: ATP-grasp domain-containing protein [Candidatus Krumholzibacteriota bacterium]|nr:ATP-grasp domain-containing protein [Candidatus Krumholzibacteriota bacterium]